MNLSFRGFSKYLNEKQFTIPWWDYLFRYINTFYEISVYKPHEEMLISWMNSGQTRNKYYVQYI